jgi:succinate dehydrogenase / fumarate reductase cytochrome b subunit
VTSPQTLVRRCRRDDDQTGATGRNSATGGSTVPDAPGGTLYRGREGMWSWVAHRVTGVLIFFFLLVHVLDTALVRVDPEAYNAVIGAYKTPVMGLGEAGLVAAIVFHAFNGIRIVLVDYWAKGPKYQRTMLYVVLGLFVVTMAGFLPRHLINVFGGGH